MIHDPVDCQTLVELVTDWLEGELPDPTRGEFELHVATCAGCIAYVEQMRMTRRRWLGWTASTVPMPVDGATRGDLLAIFRAPPRLTTSVAEHVSVARRARPRSTWTGSAVRRRRRRGNSRPSCRRPTPGARRSVPHLRRPGSGCRGHRPRPTSWARAIPTALCGSQTMAAAVAARFSVTVTAASSAAAPDAHRRRRAARRRCPAPARPPMPPARAERWPRGRPTTPDDHVGRRSCAGRPAPGRRARSPTAGRSSTTPGHRVVQA